MVYIVIPVFNRWMYTKACLESLQKQTYNTSNIIVVDHGSTDGTSEFINHDYPNVILVKGDESLWWTGATNLGVKKALCLSSSDKDFILTLNNDLEVDENYLTELLNVYEKNKPCLVGSTSVDINNPDKITFIGGTWNKYTAKFKVNPLLKSKYNELKETHEYVTSDLLPGRGVLIPINAFKRLGLYDTKNFPHYTADDDFSLRCYKGGYKLIVSVKGVVKSHVDNHVNCVTKKASLLEELKYSFLSIKSPNRFSIRFRWAKKHTPIPYIYFFFDILRILGSAIKKKI